MKYSEFYVGQRVKQKDPDEGYMCYGKVKEIKPNSVIIDWDDPNWGMLENTEHFEDEYPSILIGIPGY